MQVSRQGLLAAVVVTVVSWTAAPGLATAGEVVVELLNQTTDGERFVYDPAIVRIEPGDTVVFRPTTRGHNVVSIDGMVPDGAEPLEVGYNQEASITFDMPGIYGFKCTPHAALGMVTLIVVGNPSNPDRVAEAAERLPPKARERIHGMLTTL